MSMVRKLLVLILAVAAWPMAAAAQGVRYDNMVLSAQGLPVAGANVAVCTVVANTSTTPCSPLAPIYSDRAETQPLANPTQSTGLGNYGFFASPGSYLVQIYGGQLATTVYTVTLPCDPSAPNSCPMTGGLSTTSAVSTGTLSVTGNISATGTVSGSNIPNPIPSISGTPTAGDCAKWSSATSLADQGASCGGGSGGGNASSDAVIYVSRNGNDNNSGLSWATAKQTLYAAWNTAYANGGTPGFGGNSGGTIYVAAGVSCGGPVAGQGLWIMGNGDPNQLSFSGSGATKINSMARSSNVVTVTLAAAPPGYYVVGAALSVYGASDSSFNGNFTLSTVSGSTLTYAQTGANGSVTAAFVTPGGWVEQMPVRIVGVGTNTTTSNSRGPAVQITCGSSASANLPGIWISGTNWPMTFQNLGIQGALNGPFQAMRIGIDSNSARATNSGAVSLRFTGMQFNPDIADAGAGPGVDIGSNVFWVWFNFCTFQGANGAAGGTDKRQGLVLDPGSGSAQQAGLVYLYDNEFNSGGVVVHGEHGNTSSLYVNGLTTENQADGMAAVTIYSADRGTYTIANVTAADASSGTAGLAVLPAPGQSWPLGEPDPSFVVAFNIHGNGKNVVGPALVLGGDSQASQVVYPSRYGETGFLWGRAWGQVDDARRQFGFVTPRFAQITDGIRTSLPSSWLLAANMSEASATAPDGTSNAGAITMSSGSGAVMFSSGNVTPSAGDYYIVGAWSRSTSANGYSNGIPFQMSVENCTVAGNGNVVSSLGGLGAGSDAGQFGSQLTGDGQWEWSSKAFKQTTVNPGTCTLIFEGFVSQTNPAQFYAPVVLRIPAGTISDNEAAELAAHLAGFSTSCPVGTACTLQGVAIEIGGSGDNFLAKIDHTALTSNQTYTLPATGGTFLLTSSPGTANVIPKFTGTSAIGGSALTDNGTLVQSSEEIQLTGTSYPNLDHEPVAYTAVNSASQPLAAPWQIFRGTTGVPISDTTTQGAQNVFSELVGSTASASSPGPAAIRAFAISQSGTGNVFAVEAQCQTNTTTGGAGCIAIHGSTTINAAGGSAFGGWFQAFDNGLAGGATPAEFNLNSSAASRTYGQDRGINDINFVGSGTTAGSSGDPSNDWGLLIEGFGNGLVLSPALSPASTGGYAAYTRNLIRIRNTGGTTGNPQTTILNFEASQPAAFNYGLDFRNATFNNTGGCCAIVTAGSTVSQFGKIGIAPSVFNLAGTCTFSSSTTCSSTFTNAYTNNPFCVATMSNGASAFIINAAANATTLTLTANASNSDVADWICIANQD